jgi:polysaccharide export outer membrane protein
MRGSRIARYGLGPRLQLALALGAAASSACASDPPPPQLQSPPAGTYRVGTSDELSFRILPNPPIEGLATVRPDGRISVDLIGDVDAAGRTPEEIATEIEQRIAQYRQEPRATVSVNKASSAAIIVLGEVLRPGRYPIADQTRLAEAVALAGGESRLAAASRVRLIRWEGGRTVSYEANLDEIQDGEGSTNAVLADGDLVFVPPATPVAVGYAIRRALYPLEALLGTVTGGLVAVLAGP